MAVMAMTPNTVDTKATVAVANCTLRVLVSKKYDRLKNWRDSDTFKVIHDRQGSKDEVSEDFTGND